MKSVPTQVQLKWGEIVHFPHPAQTACVIFEYIGDFKTPPTFKEKFWDLPSEVNAAEHKVSCYAV